MACSGQFDLLMFSLVHLGAGRRCLKFEEHYKVYSSWVMPTCRIRMQGSADGNMTVPPPHWAVGDGLNTVFPGCEGK